MKTYLKSFLILSILISGVPVNVSAEVPPEQDFISIFTTVFHPGPGVDESKTVEWDFDGDGVTDSTQRDVGHVFPGPGSYRVGLKISDNNGETLKEKIITILEEEVIPPAPWLDPEWQKMIEVSISSEIVTEALIGFPVYLDLSIFPDEFFNSLKDDGADIRITASDRTTVLPIEIASINKANKTGEVYFKGDLAGNGNDKFYIYFGNQLANGFAPDHPLGSKAVWSNNYDLVAHFQNDPSSGFFDSSGNYTGEFKQKEDSNYLPSLEPGVVGNAYKFANEVYIALQPQSGSITEASLPDKDFLFEFLNKTTGDDTFFNWGAHAGSYGGRVFTSGYYGPSFHAASDIKSNYLASDIWTFGQVRGVKSSNTEEGSISIDVEGETKVTADTQRLTDITASYHNYPEIGSSGHFYVNSRSYYSGILDELRLSRVSRSDMWLKATANNLRSIETFVSLGEVQTPIE